MQSQLITIEGPLVEMMAADYRTSRPMITSTGTNLHAATNKTTSSRVVRRGHAKFERLSEEAMMATMMMIGVLKEGPAYD